MRTIEEIIQDMKAHGTSPEMIDKDIAELEAALDIWNNSFTQGRITLREARENFKMSVEEVSKETGISVKRIKKFEEDSRRMPYSLIFQLSGFYKISVDHLYVGAKTPSVENKNHLNLSLAGR
ncbi:helix-turn-helix domain-containing protein [Paenibacillus alvei]|uniref:Helix-turn-helix transcriptional regulator n=1 Tax=Paenibacillus alvei TaxID=44250 RepID=A0AAP6ZYS7_PAEAL|nr:helix-turn-helix transcriptional regulator [Paenibacillus alvei]NOJ72450.1 helix-turn-helix transcriptional regulator [Paenibacillus alvei]